MNQEIWDDMQPYERDYYEDNTHQFIIDLVPTITIIRVDNPHVRGLKDEVGVVTSSGKTDKVFTAIVIYKSEPFEMEFYSKDDDKTLDYSQAYDEAVKWAQHAAETGGDLKFNEGSN